MELDKDLELETRRIADIYNTNLNKLTTLPKEVLRSFALSPLLLPEAKSGKYRIEWMIEPARKPLTVVSHRNWLMMGYRPQKLILDVPRLFHQLLKDEQLLMSDSPQEMFLQYTMLEKAKGRVLTSGLGLGMFATMAAQKPEVTEVVAVEISRDVINLCTPKSKKIKIVNADIWEFLKTTNEKFDYIYIDIHYSTGALEYKSTVAPMRKILAERFPDTPADFWGEQEMKSQYDPDYEAKKKAREARQNAEKCN